MNVVFTIGYEGHTPESFIGKLKRNQVQILVDIREIPISRKKGFSKTALAQMLSREGIHYIHFKRLGSPSTIRHELYHNGQREAFFEEFSRYLEGEVEALEELIDLSRQARICLMCVERMPEDCHRHVVADSLKAMAAEEVVIQHI